MLIYSGIEKNRVAISKSGRSVNNISYFVTIYSRQEILTSKSLLTKKSVKSLLARKPLISTGK